MKLTPEQHRKLAKDLSERAKLSTIPEEKQEILNNAELSEALAKAKRPGQGSSIAPVTFGRKDAPAISH